MHRIPPGVVFGYEPAVPKKYAVTGVFPLVCPLAAPTSRLACQSVGSPILPRLPPYVYGGLGVRPRMGKDQSLGPWRARISGKAPTGPGAERPKKTSEERCLPAGRC